MFDVGFWELVVIGVVALLVIGPERLPAVARTAGLWFGKARYLIGTVKADIDREIRAEELKKIMADQARSSGLYDMVEQAKATLQDAKGDLESVNAPIEEAKAALSAAQAEPTPPEPTQAAAELPGEARRNHDG